ncbi:hypothetical protein [Rhodococcoides fascians]|uniref:hypothetical protein n=1 Tax=Rhodococcoides fascians TaxID=1828 RepID=UPI001427A6AA
MTDTPRWNEQPRQQHMETEQMAAVSRPRRPVVQTALQLDVSPHEIDKALLSDILAAMDGWPDTTKVRFDLSKGMDQRESDVMHIKAVRPR